MRRLITFEFSLLLAGVALRLLLLPDGIWSDEAITLRALELYSLKNPLFIGISPDPPLYGHLLKIWSLVSLNLLWLRLFSVILGISSLIIFHRLGILIKDRVLGRIFLLLAAFSPLHIYYSHELRPYALVLVLTPLLMYFWIKLIKTGEGVTGFTAVAILGFLTHYAFFLLLPVIFLTTISFLFWQRQRETIKSLILPLGVIIAFGLLIVTNAAAHGYLISIKEHVPAAVDWPYFFLPLVKVKETLLVYFQFGPFYEHLPPIFFSVGKRLILLFVLGMSLALLARRKKYPNSFEAFALLALVTTVGNLLAAYAEFLRFYPYGGRHILPLLFFWIALMAVLFDWLVKLKPRLGGLALLTVVGGFALYSTTLGRKMSFSNGYVEATRLAINKGFSSITFINPDSNSVRYLQTQYGGKIEIVTTNVIPNHEPVLIDKQRLKSLKESRYQILYTNPKENAFLIILNY